MVTDAKNKQFHEGTIRLNADDIETLAMTLQELTDEELGLGPGASVFTADESRLDRELFERFAQQMPQSSMKADPTSIDDKELWARINQARLSASDAKVSSLRPRSRILTVWSGVLAAAAGLFLAIRLWTPKSDPLDSSLNSNFKGSLSKIDSNLSTDCKLGLKIDGQSIELGENTSRVPPLKRVLLMARCKGKGYLQLELESGNDRIAFRNIPVEESYDLQDLLDSEQGPLGLAMPSEGVLLIRYGLSAEPLQDSQSGQLDSQSFPNKHESWLWHREVRLSILEQEAKP